VFPDIEIHPIKDLVTAPNAVIFTCMVTAKPQALVYLTRNNLTLSESMRYLINSTLTGNCFSGSISECVSSSTLQILNTRAADSGEYTCVATNEAGSDSRSSFLDVHGTINIYSITQTSRSQFTPKSTKMKPINIS